MYDDLIEQDSKLGKSRAKGRIKGLQSGLIIVVGSRFPSLADLARKKVKRIDKPDQLILLLKGISAAPDEASARLLLELLIA